MTPRAPTPKSSPRTGKNLLKKAEGQPFGEEEDGDLSDDQKTVEDGPEDTSRLVGNGGIGDIIVTHARRVL